MREATAGSPSPPVRYPDDAPPMPSTMTKPRITVTTNRLPIGVRAIGIVKHGEDLEARLPVKFREAPVRWHIDRSAASQHDIIVLLQNGKQQRYLSGIVAGQ